MQRAKKKVRLVAGKGGDGGDGGVPTLNLALVVAAGDESFGSLLRGRRKLRGLTLAMVADEIGCQKGYLSMIETGQRPPPTNYLVMKLERVLGFLGGELAEAAHWETAAPIVRERFLKAAHDETGAENGMKCKEKSERVWGSDRDLDVLLANGSLRDLVEQRGGNVGVVEKLTQRVPIVNRVAAGYPAEFTDLGYPARVADDYLECPVSFAAARDDVDVFAARVVGASMEPEYFEGDTIVFSPEAPLVSGSDCFVRLERDAETTFKRVFFEGEASELIRLQPLNDAFAVRVVERAEVAGMYAAVSVLRMIRALHGSR